MTAIETLVTLKDYCVEHKVDFKRARRAARKGQFAGAKKVFGQWAMDKDAPVPTLPEPKAFGTRRSDGRATFKIYLTADEATALTAGGYEVIDLKAKRAERKAKRAATVATDAIQDEEDTMTPEERQEQLDKELQAEHSSEWYKGFAPCHICGKPVEEGRNVSPEECICDECAGYDPKDTTS